MKIQTRFQLSTMMFLEYFVWGAWYVTMGTYLGQTLKFDGLEIGIAYGAVAIGAMISPFFVGMIADRYFPSEKVLATMHLVGAALLYWLTQVDSFSMFYPILIGYTLCYMPTIALTNSISFAQMKDPGAEFPSVRVLGTFGWIIAGLTIGFLKVEDSTMMFYIAAVSSLILGVYSLTLPHTPPKDKGKSVSFGDVIGLKSLALFKDMSFSVFFLASLLICIPLSFYYNFTNLYLNELGMGNAAGKMTLGQLSEFGFLLVMPLFFKRLGVKKMLLVAMLAWAARYVFFAIGNNDEMVWMLYAGIILHGICYDFFFVTGQIYVDNKAGEGIKSSAQGLITFATYGLGMFIGSAVSGKVVKMYTYTGEADVIQHYWNPIWMVPAALSVFVLIFFFLLFREKVNQQAVNEES
ncbi:nucleoside permease [Flammeovirgaceae bacterium SG7u.111]|nr:nucleoside permease [Flammeovirgaceae bacterium SG7u.132]WPO37968.1 nucleoside permease [Flammeovirgaceae bacterium SG7u.111]